MSTTSTIDSFESLGAAPMNERVDFLVTALREWAAKELEVPVDQVPLESDLREECAEWAVPGVLYRGLEKLVTREIGFSGFYEAEVNEWPSIRGLAEYLAQEVDLPPAPPPGSSPFKDPEDMDEVWEWPKPKPYTGEERVEEPMLKVIGTPRAGTTLFRTMLAGHDEIYSPPELHLLPFDTLGERRRALDPHGNEWMRHGLCQTFARQLNLSEGQSYIYVDRLEERDLSTVRTYRLLHSQNPKGWLVDESPSSLRHEVWIRRAEQMFLEPRYLYLTRHPCAVIESIVRMRFRRLGKRLEDINPWLAAEKRWTLMNQVATEFLAEVPKERWHRVRYEDLVVDPEGEMRKVASFLGLEDQEAMGDPYSGDKDRGRSLLGDPGQSRRKALNPELADAWRKSPPPQEFHSMTKEIAAKLGYEL